MKKHFFYFLALFLFVGILFCSCEKRYKYIAEVRETDVLGHKSIKEESPVIIKAASDTAAYIRAYSKFSAAKRTFRNLSKEGMKYLTEPLSFRLYDSKGNDITDIYFVTKYEQEKRIDDIMASIGKSSNTSSNVKKLGDWKIGNYVDDFGDKTGNKYIYQKVYGTFSNSATTNSDLLAEILIDKNDIRLYLQEYASHYVNDERVELKLKRNDTILGKYGTYITHKYGLLSNELRTIFLQGGKIKFYGETEKYHSKSTYNFVMDFDCLQNALDELNNKEEIEKEK